ncbi:SGNH/GDSL hydrolase family protein [Calycomorphotria hydatis]|uniref:GDSL-like Lipase/Acylhydrolase n=1 Tax=Calycomorphotria hydatis TaxID=2528027 RepID=A0A517T7U5_9PLAN|nr:SGNH/GDSL hydrolase family protein [Calycomorphotria hydatis]QDT64446.1 hypothetical protein V22_16800 [Calycomorphotria hydatis]
MRLLSCLSVALVVAAAQFAVADADSQIDKQREREFQDLKKRFPASFNEVQEEASLPNVLLIGDSISIGYTPTVQKELKGTANVLRIPANGASTKQGLENIDFWLGDKHWDVIHFNWGLHDMKHIDAKGRMVPVSKGERQTTLEEYRTNLTKLVDRLEQTGAVLIWRTTTPVPDGTHARIAGEAVDYNAVAEPIMRERGIMIDDLYGFANSQLDKIQKPRNVHFTNTGSRLLGEHVAGKIREALKKSEN